MCNLINRVCRIPLSVNIDDFTAPGDRAKGEARALPGGINENNMIENGWIPAIQHKSRCDIAMYRLIDTIIYNK